MKSVFLLGSVIACLASCCAPTNHPVSFLAPYSDGEPIPPERFSRRYLEVLGSKECLSRDHSKVMVCGMLGSRRHPPGVTIEVVLKSVRLKQPSFYYVAVWRPKDAAFYGVRLQSKSRIEPSKRVLNVTDRLLAGDVVIILEMAFAF